MEIFVKTYDSLEKDELYEILTLREEVFKLEQNSNYRDLDGVDKDAFHIFIKDDNVIKAYARLSKKDENKKIAKMGRVISRKKTYGKIVCQKTIDIAFNKLNYKEISIEAQVQAMCFYEKLGFYKTSEPYDDVGILHIDMVLKKN